MRRVRDQSNSAPTPRRFADGGQCHDHGRSLMEVTADQLQETRDKIATLQAQIAALPKPAPEQTKIVDAVPSWENPAHREVDPFDPEYDAVMGIEQGLIPSVMAAIEKGFHVFALMPKDKHPLPGS